MSGLRTHDITGPASRWWRGRCVSPAPLACCLAASGHQRALPRRPPAGLQPWLPLPLRRDACVAGPPREPEPVLIPLPPHAWRGTLALCLGSTPPHPRIQATFRTPDSGRAHPMLWNCCSLRVVGKVCCRDLGRCRWPHTIPQVLEGKARDPGGGTPAGPGVSCCATLSLNLLICEMGRRLEGVVAGGGSRSFPPERPGDLIRGYSCLAVLRSPRKRKGATLPQLRPAPRLCAPRSLSAAEGPTNLSALDSAPCG